MWAHCDMKIQIPHFLLLTRYVGTVCGMQRSGFVLPTPRLGVLPGFESRYRSLSGGSVRCAFYAHPGTPRLGFYRYGLKDHSAYAYGSHSGLPGRRKTAYQVT